MQKGNQRKKIIGQSTDSNTKEFEVEESARHHWCTEPLQKKMTDLITFRYMSAVKSLYGNENVARFIIT